MSAEPTLVELDPNPRVVSILEELLTFARAGKLRGIAYVGVLNEDGCVHGYRGERRPFVVVGLMEALKNELLDKGSERPEDLGMPIPEQVEFSD